MYDVWSLHILRINFSVVQANCGTLNSASVLNCATSNCGTLSCDTLNCDTSNCDTLNCDTSNCDTLKCDASNCDTSNCDASICDTFITRFWFLFFLLGLKKKVWLFGYFLASFHFKVMLGKCFDLSLILYV